MESAKSNFQQQRANLWVIIAQKSWKVSDPRGLLVKKWWFPILLDSHRKVAKQYGVYQFIGWDAFRIARPSAFVIGTDRRVAFLFVSSRQTERVDLEDVSSALGKM